VCPMARTIGLLILVFLGLSFILKRPPKINYGTFEGDPDLIFQRHKRKGGNIPLQKEFDIPADDTTEKDPRSSLSSFPVTMTAI
jgi:hypothetical protein